MRCLVTGHKGYIGSHLFARLRDLGHDVRGMDIKNEEEDILCDLDLYEEFAPEYITSPLILPPIISSISDLFTEIVNTESSIILPAISLIGLVSISIFLISFDNDSSIKNNERVFSNDNKGEEILKKSPKKSPPIPAMVKRDDRSFFFFEMLL